MQWQRMSSSTFTIPCPVATTKDSTNLGHPNSNSTRGRAHLSPSPLPNVCRHSLKPRVGIDDRVRDVHRPCRGASRLCGRVDEISHPKQREVCHLIKKKPQASTGQILSVWCSVYFRKSTPSSRLNQALAKHIGNPWSGIWRESFSSFCASFGKLATKRGAAREGEIYLSQRLQWSASITGWKNIGPFRPREKKPRSRRLFNVEPSP